MYASALPPSLYFCVVEANVAGEAHGRWLSGSFLFLILLPLLSFLLLTSRMIR